MKLEKIRILISQFDLRNPRANKKLFFQDANFLQATLTIKDWLQFQKTKSEEMVASLVDNK